MVIPLQYTFYFYQEEVPVDCLYESYFLKLPTKYNWNLVTMNVVSFLEIDLKCYITVDVAKAFHSMILTHNDRHTFGVVRLSSIDKLKGSDSTSLKLLMLEFNF